MAKPLTEEQIDNIISLYSHGFSKRAICRQMKHGVNQVIRYTRPEYLATKYNLKCYECSIKESIMNYSKELYENEVTLWKRLFSIVLIGFIAQILINIFF